ncbi:MAG: hypothetical protein AAB460_03105 [Patescibacteria group bacterium]
MTRRYIHITIGILAGVLFLAPFSFVRADDEELGNLEKYQKELQEKLDKTLDEIKKLEVFSNQKGQERASLERDVALLEAEIKKSQLSIDARNLEIKKLGGEIGERTTTITALEEKYRRQQSSLAQLIRTTNEIDDYSLVEIALSNQNVSEFFHDLDSFDSITNAIQSSFREIETTKEKTEEEKKGLEEERLSEIDLKRLQELEKQKVEVKEAEKEQVLNVTRGQEAVYQTLIAQKEQTAAQIRAELFRLRGSSAISFGDALAFAEVASKETGVRPAHLLGTLQEETRLGEFLGTGNWKVDMHPTRDQPVFEALMKKLGLDPDTMPVSKKPSYGWGGAMGPAQFIPSTWVLYEDRIGQATGNTPPNPYNPEDAFMAAAILLSDNGAFSGDPASERLASLRYFAGWKNASNPAYAFYGNEVMALTEGYQKQIDIINKEEEDD